MTDIAVEISLEAAQALAQRAVRLLAELRDTYNLSAFEFTHAVRIAPFEVPHSHPVLTLSCRWVDDPDRFLAMYLHEQMHWYLAEHRNEQTRAAIRALDALYPNRPSALAESARDDDSVLLHLVVNFLEVCALEKLIGSERTCAVLSPPPVYPWCYRTVIEDRGQLGALLSEFHLAPVPDARQLV